MVHKRALLLSLTLLLPSITATWIPEKKPCDDPPPVPAPCDKGCGDGGADRWHGHGWGHGHGHGHGHGDGGEEGGGHGHGDQDGKGDKGDTGDKGDKGGGGCKGKCSGDTPGGTDPGGNNNQTLPDPAGPDPESETFQPELQVIVRATEAAGPVPEVIDFVGDEDDEDTSVSDFVPFDYCEPEGYADDGTVVDGAGDGTGIGSGNVSSYTAARGRDYCLETYGDDALGASAAAGNDTDASGDGNVTRRDLHARTFASTLGTGTPNRWRRGSVVSICVLRNNDYIVPYTLSLIPIRASQVVAAAMQNAIDLWNAGLNPKLVSFEYVTTCKDAVYRTIVVDRGKAPGVRALATTPYPAKGTGDQGFRDIYVWNESFNNSYQNVLTEILSHELGHAIGIGHEDCKDIQQSCKQITPVIADSVINSTVPNNITTRAQGPTQLDIDGVNAYYSLPGGGGSPDNIVLWPATRGPQIQYPPLPRCRWVLGICIY